MQCLTPVSNSQGYGQEFPPSQQPPHLMGYSGNRGYKVALMEHTTTGSTSNCSSPSSLQSPITSMVSIHVYDNATFHSALLYWHKTYVKHNYVNLIELLNGLYIYLYNCLNWTGMQLIILCHTPGNFDV